MSQKYLKKVKKCRKKWKNEPLFDIMNLVGAPVRRLLYSWWKANLVISSQEPVARLPGAEVVRLGLSNG